MSTNFVYGSTTNARPAANQMFVKTSSKAQELKAKRAAGRIEGHTLS